MNNRTPITISAILIGAMLAASAWAWSRIPAGAQIPIHWGIHGEPNGFASTPVGLLLQPGVAALLVLLFAVIPVIEPRRLNLARSAKFYHATWIATVALLAFIHGLALYSAVYGGAPVGSFIMAAVSVVIAIMGNYLGKTRSMFLTGVRTPWTLSSEYSWQRTSRLLGRLFMAIGLLGFVAAIALPMRLATEMFICALIAVIVFSLVMSYVFWRRDPEREAENGQH
jgi:uncharacterized membrane protein